MPIRQPITAISSANTGAFTRPMITWRGASASCSRATKVDGVMSSIVSAISAAPASPARSPTKTSSGSDSTSASTRGITSTCATDRPSTAIASVSSFRRIVPSCAANEAPERPATITATISGENSRVMPRATPSTTKMLAPYCSACRPSR